jgi:AraC-like DNA-binding protein
MEIQMDKPFSITDPDHSHSIAFKADRSSFQSEQEPAGQLVMCQSGEIELYGHNGEWAIPADYMVFIPAGRMFRIRIRMPSSGLVMKFCKNEVTWNHDGCWVGQIPDIAAHMAQYSLKWSPEEERCRRKSKAFFLTLGDMVPGWFQHERIMWTPYAENSAIQRVIDFARSHGPATSLPEVAEHVGMSERTLRRHMQTELGQSWREFIRELRMNKAMELLRKEKKSVTETAFEVGFSSSSAFSNAFLDYVGKTPSAFARSVRPGAERISSL